MQDLKDIIQSGKLYIPNDKPHLTLYKQKISEITVLSNGTLLKQNKIILPHSLHEKVIRLVHNGSIQNNPVFPLISAGAQINATV